MDLEFLTLSHTGLKWNDELPLSFKGVRLPGSMVLSSVGDFGSICIQEFKTDNFSIRFNVLDLLQRFVVSSFAERSNIITRLVLKGKMINETANNKKWTLNKNQFDLFNTEKPVITEVYEKSIHISFETFYSQRFSREILKLFPVYDKANHGWADSQILELIHSILRCKYEKEIRRHYFESRVKDLLFKYLVRLNDQPVLEKEVSENELNAVYMAEEIITNNIAEHHTIPELSKKILLNEFRLKYLFKKIFGLGPYEYLIRKRLNRSKELLEAGLSIKEVAAQVGYRPSDFTTSFRNHFGFRPSEIKRKNL